MQNLDRPYRANSIGRLVPRALPSATMDAAFQAAELPLGANPQCFNEPGRVPVYRSFTNSVADTKPGTDERASVLDCGSPLPLLRAQHLRWKSGRGLPQSRTLRSSGAFSTEQERDAPVQGWTAR